MRWRRSISRGSLNRRSISPSRRPAPHHKGVILQPDLFQPPHHDLQRRCFLSNEQNRLLVRQTLHDHVRDRLAFACSERVRPLFQILPHQIFRERKGAEHRTLNHFPAFELANMGPHNSEKASGDRSDKTEGQAQIAAMNIIEDNRNRPRARPRPRFFRVVVLSV